VPYFLLASSQKNATIVLTTAVLSIIMTAPTVAVAMKVRLKAVVAVVRFSRKPLLPPPAAAIIASPHSEHFACAAMLLGLPQYAGENWLVKETNWKDGRPIGDSPEFDGDEEVAISINLGTRKDSLASSLGDRKISLGGRDGPGGGARKWSIQKTEVIRRS